MPAHRAVVPGLSGWPMSDAQEDEGATAPDAAATATAVAAAPAPAAADATAKPAGELDVVDDV